MSEEPIESLPIVMTAEQAVTLIKILVARLGGAVQVSAHEWDMSQRHILVEEGGLLISKQIDWEE